MDTDAVAERVLAHRRAVLLCALLVTAVLGAGVTELERTSSLDHFRTDSTAADALDAARVNYTTAPNETAARIVVRDDNVLDRETLLSTLALQSRLRDRPAVDRTLRERPFDSVATAVATAALRRDLRRDVRELRALRDQRASLRRQRSRLNRTARALRAALVDLETDPTASIDAALDEVRADTDVELTAAERRTFRRAIDRLRTAETDDQRRRALRAGSRGLLSERHARLDRRASSLAERAATLEDRVERRRATLRDGPSLADQRRRLQSANASTVRSLVERTLRENGSEEALALLPSDYEPGTATSTVTVVVVRQRADGPIETNAFGGGAPPVIVESQLAVQSVAADHGGATEHLVVGPGVVRHEIDESMLDSLWLVAPVAVLFVVGSLWVAYRDPIDVALGLLGVVLVLTWTFGVMGWTGITFSQVFVATPVLLAGLSIDFALHLVMRHREVWSDPGVGPRSSMRTALGDIGLALVLVAVTTAVGFLANVTSPVGPIREFGVVNAVGIVAALVVFGLLVPSLKLEVDELLARRGRVRRAESVGTSGSAGRTLSALARLATGHPRAVLAAVLLVSAAGAYGATGVETSFDRQDFLAPDPADALQAAPEPVAADEYEARAGLAALSGRFVRRPGAAQVVVDGAVTRPAALSTAESVADALGAAPVTGETADGSPPVTTPGRLMRSVAAENDTFAATLSAADRDGDGLPNRDVRAVYDALFAAAPDRAGRVLHRTDDGRYVGLRLLVGVDREADGAAVRDRLRAAAATVERADGLEATATGPAVVSAVIQRQLLSTVAQGMLLAVVAVSALLLVTYRRIHDSAALGAVTMVPVVLNVVWILGTMALLGVPFNFITGMIASLTVGLGVDYSVHASERFARECRDHDVTTAVRHTLTGTGGALLGSAVTTALGFGVLSLSLLPPLAEFGLITALTIVYALVASVVVLPSLLVLWTRHADHPAARSDPVSTGDEDGSRGVRTGTAGEPTPDSADRPTTPGAPGGETGDGVPTARRQVRGRVTAGEPVTVTVTVDADAPDGLRLREAVRGGRIDDVAVRPTPATGDVGDGGLRVGWADPADETVVAYRLRVPDDPDAAVDVDGRVDLNERSVPVEGPRRLSPSDGDTDPPDDGRRSTAPDGGPAPD